jgi:hypothetical protein
MGVYDFVLWEPMNPTAVRSETRELAERLVAVEAAAKNPSKDDAHATCRVCEKMRGPLITLTGTAGYSSLLLRALTLAKREASALSEVQVKPDGSLEGLDGEAAQAHPILVSYLLSLLITFIGEALTMRLLHDIWPDLPNSDLTSSGRNRNESAQ